MQKKILLVDGMSAFCRAYYAMVKTDLKNKAGISTFAIKWFFSILSTVKKTYEIDEIIMTWDTKTSKNKNKLIDENYKANREPNKKVDFYDQINIIKSVLQDLWIWQFESKHYEADDVISTFKNIARNKYWEELEIFILSQDTDLYQMFDERTYFIKRNTNKDAPKGDILYKVWQFLEDYHLENPKQYILFKSITGDSADNVKGLEGVWPKNALKILNECDYDISKLLEHPKIISQPNFNLRKNILIITLEEHISNEDIDKTKWLISSEKIIQFIEEFEMESLKKTSLFVQFFN